jgi:predicted RNA-binding protein Jag
MKSVSLILIWFLVITTAVAQAEPDTATSVVVNIRHTADEVSTQVYDDLRTRINDMKQRWKDNLQKTTALLEQAKTRKDPAIVEAFEAQLSRTMQQAGEDLAALLAQRGAVLEALDKLGSALTEGIRFFQEVQTRIHTEAARLGEQHARLTGRLRELAQRYRRVILHGQLPPEMDVLVRELEARRHTLVQREQIKQRTAAEVAAQLEQLKQRQTFVRVMRGLSQLAFVQADGHLQVLGDLAELRRTGTFAMALSQETAAIAQNTVAFSETIQKFRGDLIDLSTLPMPGDVSPLEASTVPTYAPEQGREILKNYLGEDRQRSGR